MMMRHFQGSGIPYKSSQNIHRERATSGQPSTFQAFRNSNIFYIIVGVALAVGVNQALALALGTPMPIVAVESNSMVPTFSRGDILVLVGVPDGGAAVGDIIVYLPDGHQTPIVHRVIAINDDGSLQTKGDANANQFEFERRIDYRQIRGKEVLVIPFLGWVKIMVTDAFTAVARLVWR